MTTLLAVWPLHAGSLTSPRYATPSTHPLTVNLPSFLPSFPIPTTSPFTYNFPSPKPHIIIHSLVKVVTSNHFIIASQPNLPPTMPIPFHHRQFLFTPMIATSALVFSPSRHFPSPLIVSQTPEGEKYRYLHLIFSSSVSTFVSNFSSTNIFLNSLSTFSIPSIPSLLYHYHLHLHCSIFLFHLSPSREPLPPPASQPLSPSPATPPLTTICTSTSSITTDMQSENLVHKVWFHDTQENWLKVWIPVFSRLRIPANPHDQHAKPCNFPSNSAKLLLCTPWQQPRGISAGSI